MSSPAVFGAGDSAATAVSLAAARSFRAGPVLDCAARLPNSLKYRGSRNKIVLRKLAARYLPEWIAQKPKSGFRIPLDSWLESGGRVAVQRLLESSRARIRELIRPEYTSPLLKSFVKGRWDRSTLSRFGLYQRVYALWSLENWLNRWRPTL